jgi:hypothetical protein
MTRQDSKALLIGPMFYFPLLPPCAVGNGWGKSAGVGRTFSMPLVARTVSSCWATAYIAAMESGTTFSACAGVVQVCAF